MWYWSAYDYTPLINSLCVECVCPKVTQTETLITLLIMSKTFALFLLENANNGNEILAVLDDIVEVENTPL